MENGKDSVANSESFRDHISTVKDGKRAWLFPKQPVGKFYNARTWLSLVYLIIFFALPFIKLDGEPLFLFDILSRKFILFGTIFWPKDFFIFVLAMIIFLVFIVLFTVVFGRIFCGWACPQTIFMEMVFRRVEYWIEGNNHQQQKLAQMPLGFEKLRKKTLKHLIFLGIAFLIANTFLAYVIGIDKVKLLIVHSPAEHLSIFIPLILFTGVFYWVFSWFREQVCIVACPYGRLQGVMLDKNSILVIYDYLRGEPRGKFKRNEEREIGDCVSCNLCVDVCPTGIDIRNGTQLECVNCTACIDACNDVMNSVHLPKGLIRYDSEAGVSSGKKLRLNSRIIGYSFVLVSLIGVFTYLMATRSDIDAVILRLPGMSYQEIPGDKIANMYSLKLFNKTKKNASILIRLENIKGDVRVMGNQLKVPPSSILQSAFMVTLHEKNINKRKMHIELGIYVDGERIDKVETNFMAPVSN